MKDLLRDEKGTGQVPMGTANLIRGILGTEAVGS